jgi:ribosomal protein L30E
MNILILGRSLDQQITYQNDYNSSIESLILNLKNQNIKLKDKIDIYFCDICSEVNNRIYNLNLSEFNKMNNTNYIINLISKKVKIGSDYDSYKDFYNKIDLKNEIDIIINDTGTIYSFEFYTLVDILNNFLKINGKAFLLGFKYHIKNNICENLKSNDKIKNGFYITIKFLNNKKSIFLVNNDTLLKEIKQKVDYYSKNIKYPYKLVFAGKSLDLNKKIKNYNIQEHAVIHQVLGFRVEETDLSRFKNIVNIYPQLTITPTDI